MTTQATGVRRRTPFEAAGPAHRTSFLDDQLV
jgi:hypothetical protein